MRIIIIGAGRVGESVAESLVSEQNDITVVDWDPQRLRDLEDRYDLRGIAGNAIQPSVLERAGIRDADMLIACAALDETNLVACKVAHARFGVPSTIARLRSPQFIESDPLLDKSGFAVDHVICPEESVVRYIEKLIAYPEALQVLEFSKGRAHLIAVRATAGSALVGHTIAEFRDRFPAAKMRVVAVYRDEAEQSCDATTRIEPGDEVFLLADQEHIRFVLAGIHNFDHPVRRVMIAGGGNVGLRLARRLAGQYEVKLIERDPKRCEYLASQLPSQMLVLQRRRHRRGTAGRRERGQHGPVPGAHQRRRGQHPVGHAGQAAGRAARAVADQSPRLRRHDAGQRRSTSRFRRPTRSSANCWPMCDAATWRRCTACAAARPRRSKASRAATRKTSKLVGRRVEQLEAVCPPAFASARWCAGDGRQQRVLMPHHDTVIETDDHVIMFMPHKRMVRDVERCSRSAPPSSDRQRWKSSSRSFPCSRAC